MRRYVFPIIVCIFCSFFSPLAATAGELPEFKVAIADWPPWKIVEGDRFDGIDVDILAEVGRRANVSWEYTECPWRRCLEMMKTGQVDVVTSLSKTAERQEYMLFLGPYYHIEKVSFYTLKGSDVQVSVYDDLYGHTIGAVKGSVYFTQFDTDSKILKEEVTQDRQHLQMLLSKRVDLVISYETIMDYLLANFGWQDRVEKVEFSHDSIPSYLALSKSSPLLDYSDKLTNAVKEMVQSGEIEKIKKRFMMKVHPSPK